MTRTGKSNSVKKIIQGTTDFSTKASDNLLEDNKRVASIKKLKIIVQYFKKMSKVFR